MAFFLEWFSCPFQKSYAFHETNSSILKINGWMNFLQGWPVSRGEMAVSFREFFSSRNLHTIPRYWLDPWPWLWVEIPRRVSLQNLGMCLFLGLNEQWKKGPNGCLGDLLRMKSYPVVRGLCHKPWNRDARFFRQPGFNGKWGGFFIAQMSLRFVPIDCRWNV